MQPWNAVPTVVNKSEVNFGFVTPMVGSRPDAKPQSWEQNLHWSGSQVLVGWDQQGNPIYKDNAKAMPWEQLGWNGFDHIVLEGLPEVPHILRDGTRFVPFDAQGNIFYPTIEGIQTPWFIPTMGNRNHVAFASMEGPLAIPKIDKGLKPVVTDHHKRRQAETEGTYELTTAASTLVARETLPTLDTLHHRQPNLNPFAPRPTMPQVQSQQSLPVVHEQPKHKQRLDCERANKTIDEQWFIPPASLKPSDDLIML
jgi:hypothetical protein